MTTLDFVGSSTSFLPLSKVNRFGIVLVQLHDELWRVTRRSGEVLGYIESFGDGGDGNSSDRRYRAKRMFSSRRPSMPLGEFWSLDDAIDCFRFS